jgi:cell division protein FtsQ
MAMRNIRSLERRKEKRRLRNLVLFPVLAAALFLAAFSLAKNLLRVKEIVFTGNHHLKNEELGSLIRIKKNSGLFGVSGRDIYLGLRQSPWIKDAVVRKELSGRVLINVAEREPVALLSLAGKHFLIDNEGMVLEEMKEGTMLLLPVIKDIDPAGNRETYAEAVRFVDVLHDKRVVSYDGNIEISGERPEDITLKIDKIIIKVGIGDFDKKLARLDFVRDEIQRRNITVEYIDLRFANKIIVKPVQSDAGAGEEKKDVHKQEEKSTNNDNVKKAKENKGKKKKKNHAKKKKK